MQPRRLEDAKGHENTKKIKVLLAVIAVAGLGAIPQVRQSVLRDAGQMLVLSDVVEPADLLAMDVESGWAGALKVSDLYRVQAAATVGVLRPNATAVDREFARRGVVLPDVLRITLEQLGIPKTSIVEIPAGEGGTTESTAALAEWARAHPGTRVLVVVGPSHGRRYRRAIRRAWPVGQRSPLVVTTSYGLFRPEDWWQSRTTLREGLVELEKLTLDYVAHPW